MDELKFIDKTNYNMYIKLDSDGYRHIGDYSEGKFSTMHTNGICGYINESGYETFLFDYTVVEDFNNGRALVKNIKGLYGYIDDRFNEIIPCSFIYATGFYCGYAIVNSNYKNKIIDINGNVVKELGEQVDFNDVLKVLYKNKIISKELYFSEKNKDIMDDITKKINEFPIIGKKTYSYYKDDERIIDCENLCDREFCGDFVVIKIDDNNFKIFNRNGKVLKVHSCIGFDIINNKSLFDRAMQLRYTISCIENVGYSSTIEFDGQEYIIIAANVEDLNKKKIEFLSYIKGLSIVDAKEVITSFRR